MNYQLLDGKKVVLADMLIMTRSQMFSGIVWFSNSLLIVYQVIVVKAKVLKFYLFCITLVGELSAMQVCMLISGGQAPGGMI